MAGYATINDFMILWCKTMWVEVLPAYEDAKALLVFLGVIWGEFRNLGSNEPNQCKPNQSTYRQCLPKVCVQQFHSQDEDWFEVFWAVLVHFGLGIIRKEGFCQILSFGVLRSKSSNLEVQKKWGVDVEMSPYLRRYKYLVKEVYWWNVVYCKGVWVVAFNFWFLKIFIWFLGGAKVRVKKSFFIENLKMDTGQFFLLICGYCCETMCKSSIWSNLFYLGVCWMNSQVVNIEWEKVRILT